jgi:ATP-dependent DNA helicase RecG
VARAISEKEALEILGRGENHVWDDKSAKAKGATLQKIACAFANAEGGEFGVGIEDRKTGLSGLDRWQGFSYEEEGNHIHQTLVRDIKPAIPYVVEWLEIEGQPERGLVALVTIQKSDSVHETAAGETRLRNGAASLTLNAKEAMDLSLSKGASSYEDQALAKLSADDLAKEEELRSFLESYSPTTEPLAFIHKLRLADEQGQATVASAVLYASNPPAVIPKKCAIKIARYQTGAEVGKREHLDGTPITVEGPAYSQIQEALRIVTEIIESVPHMESDGALTPVSYPPEALKEIVVNAVIHRDYNISDDIHILIFDNRVEVRSPGVLPGHMTIENLLTERVARNRTISRLLNLYPDAPNKDIGEGLNTVFDKMKEAKLKEPIFKNTGNSFVVILGHAPLARPHGLVMKYLESNDEITNSIARGLTGITSENTMKEVFKQLQKNGHLERVPEKLGNKAAWRKPAARETLWDLDKAPPA